MASASSTPGRRHPGVVVTGQGGVGGARAGPQLLGVPEPLGLDAQRGVLARLGVEGLDALEAHPQGVGLTGPLGRGGAQVGQLGLGRR